jgi:predicted aldo/keto reductase-like oxidoreductase
VSTANSRNPLLLDNCWDYHDGLSERRMGQALADGRRGNAFLMTKLDGQTAKAATEQLEQSLSRLKTDFIDLVQIHEVIRMKDAERCFAKNGAIEALVRAKRAGKLRYIGFTGHKDPAIHMHMLETAKRNGFRFDTVQMPLNVLDPHYRSFERDVLPTLLKQQIGVLGMKPLASGAALRTGVAAKECLRYAMSLPEAIVITGCDSMRVLDQALEVAIDFRPLDASARQALQTAPSGKDGHLEGFKTTETFDSTARHPEWLG